MHGRSAMKVNTDGVLFGAWLKISSTLSPDKKIEILDIGTGTGVIALIIAQRLQYISPQARILAIDSDEPSAIEAKENFSASPWGAMLEAKHLSIQELAVRICRVKTVSDGKIKRALMEFKKTCVNDNIMQGHSCTEETLTIQEEANGQYTNEYRRLTGDLYLNF